MKNSKSTSKESNILSLYGATESPKKRVASKQKATRNDTIDMIQTEIESATAQRLNSPLDQESGNSRKDEGS